jgi:hypothetical protein
MGQAWRKSYSGMSTEEWLPPADAERPRRDDHRSPEAIARRREIRARRGYELGSQPARAVDPAPAEPPAPPDFGIRLPDSCSWGERYCRWMLPTHSGKDGLSYREVMEIQLRAKRIRENADPD